YLGKGAGGLGSLPREPALPGVPRSRYLPPPSRTHGRSRTMNTTPPQTPTEPPTTGFRQQPAWLVAAAVGVVAQAGLALALFGPGRQWDAVTDDRPVLSGRHPLHQYHGSLGASAFRTSRSTTCYDPAFQAGYPKTPVFDGGSRPAELFALL